MRKKETGNKLSQNRGSVNLEILPEENQKKDNQKIDKADNVLLVLDGLDNDIKEKSISKIWPLDKKYLPDMLAHCIQE